MAANHPKNDNDSPLHVPAKSHYVERTPPCPPSSLDYANVTPGGMLDPSNPYAFVNFLAPKFKEAVLTITPSWWTLSERQLRKKSKPDPEDSRLRYALWTQFDLAIERGQDKIDTAEAIRGICSSEYFYKRVLLDEKKLAWICTPPPDYVGLMREMYERATFKMSQILEMPAYKITETVYKSKDPFKPDTVIRKKEADPRILNLQKAIWLSMQERVMGSVVQKVAIQQQSVNANIGISSDESMEDIERKLANARYKLDAASGRISPDANHILPLPAPVSANTVSMEYREPPTIDAFIEKNLSAKTAPDITDDEKLNVLMSEFEDLDKVENE